MSITEDLRILRPERGNLHGSQKPSSIGYEFYSYRMDMVVHPVSKWHEVHIALPALSGIRPLYLTYQCKGTIDLLSLELK